MAVKNVLLDGTVLDDLKGHIIKEHDAKRLYEVLGGITKSYEKINGDENKMQFKGVTTI